MEISYTYFKWSKVRGHTQTMILTVILQLVILRQSTLLLRCAKKHIFFQREEHLLDKLRNEPIKNPVDTVKAIITKPLLSKEY